MRCSIMRDVIVIGSGIIGATVARLLNLRGVKDVLVLDDRRPMGGTAPSGGHLNTAWFKGMPKAEYEPAMGVLDDCWGLIEETYQCRPSMKTTTMRRVDIDAVMASPFTRERVTAVRGEGTARPEVDTERGNLFRDTLKARHVVIAAGVWASEFVPGLTIKAKRGVSFRVNGLLRRKFIASWAPYKQIVAHRQTKDVIWIGDGSAIAAENWTLTRTAECLARCLAELGTPDAGLRATSLGDRPYAAPENKGEPCLYRKLGPAVYLATGAGKLGTIAAGWVAGKIAGEICG